MPRPCRVAKSLDYVFPIWFTQCGRVWFTHAMARLFRVRIMPWPCRSESNFSRPRHSTAWSWHGMCELASAVETRHVSDLPAFGFFRLPRGVLRRLLTKAYQSVKTVGLAVQIFQSTTRTFTKDTTLPENGWGAAWHVWICLKTAEKRTTATMVNWFRT
jgi:hypothetical protein